jgi:hypothetical protein
MASLAKDILTSLAMLDDRQLPRLQRMSLIEQGASIGVL